MSLHPGFLPPGLTLEESPLSTSLAVRFEAFTTALEAVFVKGQPAQPWLASLRGGLQSAQQVVLSSPASVGGGPSSWTARCYRHSQGDCSLTLCRVTPSRQELSFSLDSQQCLYGGFGWEVEVEQSAYFFYLQSGPAGWTLHLETAEAPPTVLLGGSLPWTQTPSRGLDRSLKDSDNGAGIGLLFGMAVHTLVTATASTTVELEAGCSQCRLELSPGVNFCIGCGAAATPEQRLCPQCHQTLDADARFCPQCGTPCPLQHETKRRE